MISAKNEYFPPLLLLYIRYYGTNLYWRERGTQHLQSTLDESFIVKGKLLPPGPGTGTHPTRVKGKLLPPGPGTHPTRVDPILQELTF